ncbi:AraC family transcriptional regulator [Acetatifactor muris]|uniref:HTH-type transcriptional regulator YesS n=1 Tax=Acetatifactor muris TaxID=879566 RepID=A0A2K4ZL77_9FIRM|nr:helix-turn-helix domain-containing protein [Acetatifactor muris]MCR2050050.1 AraC family transcriptional regulator [Acetatifactor muris]SOY31195.1 HTH-type transcriptional regulator YesS [Acetatifactor muris]
MKKRRKRSIDKNILHQYFFTYFIVLFIPLLLCCNYYVRMISVISEDDIREKKTELLHNAELVDGFIEELTYLADMLAGLPEVNIFRFQENVLEDPNTHKVIDLRDKLFNPTQINRSVFAYFLFFDRSQVVISDQITYDYEDFYDLYLRRDVDGSYGAWKTYLSDQMGKGVNALEQYWYKGEGGLELLAYSRPLPNNGYSASSGAVRIFFERSVLDDFMSVMGGANLQYILDDFGNVIYYTHAEILDEEDKAEIEALIRNVENRWQEELEEGKEQENEGIDGMWEAPVRLAGTKYYALRYSSPSGYSYCTLLQETQLNARKMASMLTVTILILLAAAVGLFLCWHMSVRSATPLNQLLKEASRLTDRDQEHSSVFMKLSDIFQYLAGVNSDLVEMMEEQKPYIRNAFVNRLLFGNPLSREEEDLLVNRMGFDRRGMVFCVLIFRIIASGEERNIDLLNTYLLSLMEMIKKEFPGSLYAATGEDQVSLIMGVPGTDRDSFQAIVEERFERIRRELPENIAERIFVYGGSVVEEIEDVYESYHNAAFAFMNEKERSENQIIWFQKNTRKTATVFPYFELSVKLTRLVTSGEEQGLHDALKEIMTEYILENNLPAWLQQILLNELKAILFRILVRLELEEQEYQKYFGELEKEHRTPLVEQVTSTLGLYRSLCALVNEKKTKEAGKMMPAILAFLDANYGNPDLSLTMVSDTFQISVPYLSSLFKASAGVNFSNYVEEVRIEKAKGLLKNTSMSVGEIAVAAGYSSTNSFSRAFRRVTGNSASEYRKN